MGKALVRVAFCFISTATFTHTAFANPAFENTLHTLIHQHIPNATLGLAVRDPQTGTILLETRSEENFYPASNTKLFSCAAALQLLGGEFQYPTTLRTSLEKLSDGTLHDNLSIVFTGDPSLEIADLTKLLSTLQAKGIQKIQGNIVIDDTAFSGPAYAPGWTWDSIPYSYSAPVTSIILNENKVLLSFEKASTLGQAITIKQSDHLIPKLKIVSSVKAVTSKEAEHQCEFDADVKHNHIHLTGCWPLDKTPTSLELALDDPRNLAKRVIVASLEKMHITLNGKIIFAKANNTPIIATHQSAPLKKLMVKSLADSNNLYTESFTKTVGLVNFGEGSFQAGTHAIQAILSEHIHPAFRRLHISDGSGQSRYNLASPYLISELLCGMTHDPQFPIFYSALSVNGKNGTLSSRLTHKTHAGKMVAKTGSGRGTSALSGYFTGRSGKQYVFSLMINQSTKRSRELKVFEDQLFHLLYEEPWLNNVFPA